MPHFPKPYFLTSRGVWKVQIRGKQHNLGADEAEAFRLYHRLMAAPPEAPAPQPTAVSVVAVLDTFLGWCKEHRAADTYEWYRWRLELFSRHVGAALHAAALKHFHIDQWLAPHAEWSAGTKHGMARAVQRAFRWALKKGYVEKNPVADYEKARPGKRTLVVSPARFAEILAAVKRQPFRDTPCRMSGGEVAVVAPGIASAGGIAAGPPTKGARRGRESRSPLREGAAARAE